MLLVGILLTSIACSAEVEIEPEEQPTQTYDPYFKSEVYKDGFAYNSVAHDLFVLIKGENWRYEEHLDYVQFYQENGDESHVMAMTSTSAKGQKEKTWRENWLRNVQKMSGYEYIGQDTLLIGQNGYEGWEYTFKAKISDSNATLKYYIWESEDRLYQLGVVTQGSFSDDYTETITTLLDSFMTYDEFKELQHISMPE